MIYTDEPRDADIPVESGLFQLGCAVSVVCLMVAGYAISAMTILHRRCSRRR
jgi:hypothetical protein